MMGNYLYPDQLIWTLANLSKISLAEKSYIPDADSKQSPWDDKIKIDAVRVDKTDTANVFD